MATSVDRFDVATGDKKPDKAPKPQAVPPPTPPPTRRRRGRKPAVAAKRELSAAVQGIIGTVGVAVYAVDQHCGTIILDRGKPLADALAKLAQTRPNIAKMILASQAMGDWGGVVFASVNIAIPIMAHHKLLPENLVQLVGQLEQPPDLAQESQEGEEKATQEGGASTKP